MPYIGNVVSKNGPVRRMISACLAACSLFLTNRGASRTAELMNVMKIARNVRNMKAVALLVVALTTSVAAARADEDSLQSSGCAPIRQIVFARGSTEAVVKDVLTRTETRCYALSARTGQKLRVKLASESDNVLFAIYQPGWNLKKGDDDIRQLGQPLKDATLDDETDKFSGRLPVSGSYLLVVGLLRGGAGDYSAMLSIH